MSNDVGTYNSFKELPDSGLTMEQALAAMDMLHPDSYARYTWEKLRHLVSAAVAGHHAPVIEDTPVKPMIRGRAVTIKPVGRYAQPKSTHLLANIAELSIPPASSVVSYGRCHVPGCPVFYAAFDEATVLGEIAPERGSLVYLLTCAPRPGVTFRTTLIGEIDHIRRYGRSSILPSGNSQVREILDWIPSAKTQADYVRLVTDAFLAELFSRKAATTNDYKASSAVAGLFLDLEVDYPGSSEALYYPSIANRGGMNIALTRRCYEEKVIPISCKAALVSAYFGYGIYKTQTIATSTTFGVDGSITWDDTGRGLG
jgi:hypothetical protein